MKKAITFILFLFVNTLWSQPKYVTTIHPFAELLKAIVDERGSVYGILPPGASPHTYELRPSDLRMVESATALFYGSSHLDAWALKFQHKNRIELLSLIPESFLIYFQEQEEKPGTKETVNSHDHHHDSSVDPHFWTDPLTIKALLPAVTEKLCLIDPNGCEIYQKNSNRFSAHLDSLHFQLSNQLAPVQGRAVMISHPFFSYFFKRYGIQLVSAVEESPGKEPTPKKIKRMVEQIRQHRVRAIFDHSQLPDRAAKVIAEAAGLKVYRLDPLGGVTGRQTYDELLFYNAKILLEALK